MLVISPAYVILLGLITLVMSSEELGYEPPH